MKVHVVRHGEAGDDVEDAYGGAADFRLTDHGRDGAVKSAHSLASASVEAIFTSPLSRASETAAILARELGGLPVTTMSDLRERNSYGVLSGVPKARAKELFGYILDDLKEKPGYSREPLLGAEDFDRFIERVRHAFQAVIDASEGAGYESVIIVTHGKFTQALCEFVFRLGDSVDLDLSDVLSVEYMPSRASLE